MLVKIIALLVTFLASCTIAPGSPEDHSVVTYYDRNRDGIADYELHHVAKTTYLSFAFDRFKVHRPVRRPNEPGVPIQQRAGESSGSAAREGHTGNASEPGRPTL